MGPLNAPWSTFLAWVVAALTVLAAVLWAVAQRGGNDRQKSRRET